MLEGEWMSSELSGLMSLVNEALGFLCSSMFLMRVLGLELSSEIL
jgi:hypothetical protein